MLRMEAQVEKAIEIAFNPSASQDLKAQAFDFLNRLREDPASWQVGLPLSLRTPRASEVVRHSSLELVINAIQTHRLDSQSLNFIKDTVIKYLQDNYTGSNGNATGDTPPIRNKISQVVTFLFVSLYAQEWTGFFDDIIALTSKDGDEMGSHSVGTEFYLRVLEFVHEEVADLMISRSDDEQRRCNELKDLIRARDAVKIASSWQTILSKWRQLDRGVTKSCLRNVSGWVSWIDISLVVNDSIINPLLEIAGQQESTATVVGMRIAAIDTFSEIVAKKMRPPDKVQLISVLNVRMIIQQLVASSALRDFRWTPKYDVDLAESVAKLVNITVQDIVKILESNDVQGDTRTKANEMLQVFVPHLLRFFSDEYDEICSTVIPSLTDLLTLFRKVVKSQGTLPADQSAMIDPIVRTIVAKMKYDETANWGEEDEQTDEAEFQELRKRLHVLQQTAATIDQNLCIDIFTSVVGDAFTRYREGDRNITWRDLDLALYEMFLFGELAVKNGGLYQKTKPSSLASERLVKMMSDMIESDLASYHHPAIQLQYMEICVRYCSFFEQHTNLIPRTLESFVNFIRSNHVKVRTRSWYLFHRYVRHLRAQLGDVSELIIQSIGDLLTIRAELPQESADDDMSSEENDQSADAIFSSQLYLFEAVGCIASTPTVPTERKVRYAGSVINPLTKDIELHVSPATGGDQQAILQIHHDIMALGTLARGYSDWNPNVASSGPPPAQEVSEEFMKAAEIILSALETLNGSMDIRSASRFAFSRLIGVLGARVLQQLQRWIDGLLSQSSTKDEIGTFLRLLDQVVFGFKTEISGILDSLLTPLLQRVFTGLAEPTLGTDDEVQLGELKREYLNFLLIVLNNDLGAVLVSSINQPIFETIITTIEHFSRDTTDYSTARLALSVADKMCLTWGGPTISNSYTPASNEPQPIIITTSAPTLPGFDTFMIHRFSPLSWSIPSSPAFNAKDPQARQVVAEIATLQQNILAKTGDQYLTYLRDVELKNMGAGMDVVEQYLSALTGMDVKAFRVFLNTFVGRGG